MLIIGAGLTGLSTAYHLELDGRRDYLVVESQDRVGGLARTETKDGFSFDHSIHILFTTDTYVEELICNTLLPGALIRHVRESFCYSYGVYTEYPYQAHTYGLPAEVVTRNILGLLEARYEKSWDGPPAHFEEWIYRTFGSGIAENFMIPYNRRMWAWDLRDMNYDWIESRVPLPRIEDVIRGALTPPKRKYGPNREFWYPLRGGIEALPRGFRRFIPGKRLRLNTSVTSVGTGERQVTLESGETMSYDKLVSTLPLPRLVNMLEGPVPPEVREAAAGLKYNRVHTVNIGLEGELEVEPRMHWVYFPGEETPFHRISFPYLFSKHMAPPGCSSIQAEVAESSHRPCRKETLARDTLDGLVRVGILAEKDARSVEQGGRVRLAEMHTLDPAYIIYDHEHRKNTDIIKQYLESENIHSAGRFGDWEYMNMDHAILAGKKAALRI